MSLVSDFFQIFICLYATLQFLFQKTTCVNNPRIKTWFKITCIPLTLILFVALLLLLIPIVAYRKVVHLILKGKYGPAYGGLVGGADAMWVAETNEARHIINSVYFFQSDKPGTDLFTYMQDFLATKAGFPFDHLTKQSMGYGFRVKNESVRKLTSTFDLSDAERSDKKLFQKKIGQLSNRAMPQNNESPIEILVCVQPVTFHKNSGATIYPILFRVHHSVADGTALLNFLLNKLSDSTPDERTCLEKPKVETMKKYFDAKYLSDLTTELIASCSRGYDKLNNTKLHNFLPLTPTNVNALHGRELSEEKIMAYHIEEGQQYVNKIKSIKRRLPGSTFSDVLMTAISASFHEFYQHNDPNPPENIPVMFTLKYGKENMEHKVSRNRLEVKLNNDFTVAIMNLPIRVRNDTECDKSDLMVRLNEVKVENGNLRDSADALIFYWYFKLLTYIMPTPFARLLLKLNAPTVVISNLPGIDGVCINGAKVKDIMFCVPHISDAGVGLAILTYDGRFQIGMNVDKAFVSDQEKVQSILDNIFKYIDRLDEEVGDKRML